MAGRGRGTDAGRGRERRQASASASLFACRCATPIVPLPSPGTPTRLPLVARRMLRAPVPCCARRSARPSAQPLPHGLMPRAAPSRRPIAAATELDRGTAFLLVPVFLAAGAIVYFSLAGEPGFCPLVAGCVVPGGVRALPSRSRPARICAAWPRCCASLGVVARQGRDLAGRNARCSAREISTQLTGRVVAIEHLANGRVRLTIDVIVDRTAEAALCAGPGAASRRARSRPASTPAPMVTGLSGCCRRPVRCGRTATTSPSRAISTASAPAAFSWRPGTRRSAEGRRRSTARLPRVGRECARNASPTHIRDQHRRRRRRDRRGAGRRRARRHPGRRQRGAAPHRHLPHHLDFRPAHGAGRRHHHGAAARRLRAVSRFLLAPAGEEICRCGGARRHRRLSRSSPASRSPPSAASSCWR